MSDRASYLRRPAPFVDPPARECIKYWLPAPGILESSYGACLSRIRARSGRAARRRVCSIVELCSRLNLISTASSEMRFKLARSVKTAYLCETKRIEPLSGKPGEPSCVNSLPPFLPQLFPPRSWVLPPPHEPGLSIRVVSSRSTPTRNAKCASKVGARLHARRSTSPRNAPLNCTSIAMAGVMPRSMRSAPRRAARRVPRNA